MIDGLMQAYHIPLHEAMRLTLPQILLLNHGSHCNYERMKKRSDRKDKKGTRRSPFETAKHNGKTVEDLSSDEFSNYLGNFFSVGTS